MLAIPPQASRDELNVLVIDGQTLVHDTIQSALVDLGVRKFKSAENAYYALTLCEQTKFDVVLISFDIRSDKDGFNLLEEMKLKGYISKTTLVIFLSADTSMTLVNCVVELQPSDFWVKPLDRKRIEKRFNYLFNIKQKLYKLSYCMDQGEYTTAIYYAERQLKGQELSAYHPQINRMIGNCLMLLMEYSQAETFYKNLATQYNYGWVKVSIARALLKQEKLAEAEELTAELLDRDDTRFTTFDILAEYYIAKEDYAKGYEIIQQATQLAPRNIDRNKKSWNLARLNHDKKGQYTATMNMAKFAKNSIHDSPDLTLNVIRSAIDLAASLNGEEANKLILKTERDINLFVNEHGANKDFKDKLVVISARMFNLKNDKKSAETLLKENINLTPTASIEDNLDKVKAFHEMGYWEDALKLLDTIKQQIEGDSFLGQVINEYLEQESQERKDIHYSPKELGEMASNHYKSKRYDAAFNLLIQTFTLSPNNPNIALSILKVLAKLVDETQLSEEHILYLDKSKGLLESLPLTSRQQGRMDEYMTNIDAQYTTVNH
ncbi:response regulator [Aliiglaciecola sp. LCG003]|uniref:response regulator n=1 Tax=Aliiglaciecola sp. LCG003 TaxID=3053655 RepID=UPI0025740D81|nr:response regulator [Aliiglaciecola sp. LCG003]WJG09629.1 response regulator [Aliiglaciecola sp. LCG003]